MQTNFDELIKKCKEIITCDTARISQYDKMFLIIGFNKNTKTDDRNGVWCNELGEEIHFDYLEEYCIASGKTEEELLDSVKEYKRLQAMNWNDYILEMSNKK